jgi:hypothetical protein
MPDNIHHLYFSSSLTRFSARLEDLLAGLRRHPSPPSPEMIDEIAYTIGELMVVLMDYHAANQEDEAVKEALAHAQRLHMHFRSSQLSPAQEVAESCDIFSREIDRLIRQSKRAA